MDPASEPAQSVGQRARTEVLALTHRAAAACLRLNDPRDAEALHDFRVALRRLRVFTRAYADELALGRKLPRRLRNLMRATGDARDAEVGLDWLDATGDDLNPRCRVGVRWLTKRLVAERDAAYERARAEMPLDWVRVESGMRQKLAAPVSDEHLSESFNAATAKRFESSCEEIERRLAAVRSVADAEEAHRARIAAKRLRYLVEPLSATHEVEVRPLLDELKRFQDLLGELNDVRIMLARLRADAHTAAKERAERLFEAALVDGIAPSVLRKARRHDPLPGLIELARRARVRRDALFAEGRQRYVEDRARRLIDLARKLVESLRAAERPRLQIVQQQPTDRAEG